MDSDRRAILTGFVRAFPPLRLALNIGDCICYVLQSIFKCIYNIFKWIFGLVQRQFVAVFTHFGGLYQTYGPTRKPKYKRLTDDKGKDLQYREPAPYKHNTFKSLLVYEGSILLGAALYIFVYFVLIKHHSYVTLGVGALLLFAYLIIIENSHTIRCILMLCLPIMFTNRGRALIFCSMLAITLSGPVKNIQLNSAELRHSLTCCKQYLIIKTDKYVDKNVVQNLISVEDIVIKVVDHVKKFTQEIKDKIRILVELAITLDRYMLLAIQELAKVVNRCNARAQESRDNCFKIFDDAYTDCLNKLGSTFQFLCEVVKPVRELCHLTKFPVAVCRFPSAIADFLDQTIGKQLRFYIKLIEDEFYIDINIKHKYSFNATKTKSIKQIYQAIKLDIDRKFWYIHIVTRIFNFVSLILVIWILCTATLYQMHYVSDLRYDNMYIDSYLEEIDKKNREKKKTKDVLLFPMTKSHLRHYMKPFVVRMNEVEMHKLYVSGFVWLVISSFTFFFVGADFAFSKLIGLINYILDEVFRRDISLADFKASGYNRTYIKSLRFKSNTTTTRSPIMTTSRPSDTLSGLYRRLMDSIEKSIPDDLSMLNSILGCQPVPSPPLYDTYLRLVYLTIITFIAVIIEAYALRTRHCVANLYYPKRARLRGAWLYRKLIEEKPKYVDDLGAKEKGDNTNVDKRQDKKQVTNKLLETGAKLLLDRAKR